MAAVVEKSELQLLLEKNITEEGLTLEEHSRAEKLIDSVDMSEEEDCWPCGTVKRSEKAIADTGMCRGHARYALRTRK